MWQKLFPATFGPGADKIDETAVGLVWTAVEVDVQMAHLLHGAQIEAFKRAPISVDGLDYPSVIVAQSGMWIGAMKQWTGRIQCWKDIINSDRHGCMLKLSV